MELTALNTFLILAGLFTAVLLLTVIERKSKKRIILRKFRSWLDRRVVIIGNKAAIAWQHFVRYILQLGWYYSLHKLLQTILTTLVAMYEYLERMFENNRDKARVLRAEKRGQSSDNHLAQMAEHKAETSLTVEEQETLRNDKLEERH